MNRSKIEWCDHTLNPITGCRHNCEYCYARRMVARFAGDVRLNKMAKKDYSLVPAADGGEDLYVLDAPMLNETGNPLVYPFGFAPTLHRYRLDTPAKLKMRNNIFVGAMADVFGSWVPDEWITEIFSICRKYPIHNYLFLTKNPERYERIDAAGILPSVRICGMAPRSPGRKTNVLCQMRTIHSGASSRSMRRSRYGSGMNFPLTG